MATNKPKITIAMTCYKYGKYIKTAIKSIVDQDYKNWELIIVDDCSPDGSVIKIKKYIDIYGISDKTKLITHDKNYGYGRSLYDAIKGGDGELIAIVDADDALAQNDSLRIMVKEHNKYPKASLCYSKYIVCEPNMKVRGVTKKDCRLPPGKTYLDTGLKIRISHLKVFKRSLYNKTEGVNSTLLKAVDKDLTLKLEEVGDLVFIDKALYYYRRHKEGLCKSFKKNSKSYIRKANAQKFKFLDDAKKRRGIK